MGKPVDRFAGRKIVRSFVGHLQNFRLAVRVLDGDQHLVDAPLVCPSCLWWCLAALTGVKQARKESPFDSGGRYMKLQDMFVAGIGLPKGTALMVDSHTGEIQGAFINIGKPKEGELNGERRRKKKAQVETLLSGWEILGK